MRYVVKVGTFANSKQSQPDPLETAITTELWRWAFLSNEARRQVTAAGCDLSVNIEFYLSGVFRLIDFTRSLGLWCDGVIELSITRINRRAFLIAGAAFCPHNLAPFEIEFHFVSRRDHEPLRTIVRFGEIDHLGEIRWYTKEKNAAIIVSSRPRCDRDWAVAVELTSSQS